MKSCARFSTLFCGRGNHWWRRKLKVADLLKQQRRRRLQKRHLKSEVALLQTRSFLLIQLVKCWKFLVVLNSKRMIRSSGKEKESRRLVFTFSTKREIRHFYVVVVQQRQRNVQKSLMHVQSCYFSNLNQFPYRRPCWRRLLFSQAQGQHVLTVDMKPNLWCKLSFVWMTIIC